MWSLKCILQIVHHQWVPSLQDSGFVDIHATESKYPTDAILQHNSDLLQQVSFLLGLKWTVSPDSFYFHTSFVALMQSLSLIAFYFCSLPKSSGLIEREEGQMFINLYMSLRLYGITDSKWILVWYHVSRASVKISTIHFFLIMKLIICKICKQWISCLKLGLCEFWLNIIMRWDIDVLEFRRKSQLTLPQAN